MTTTTPITNPTPLTQPYDPNDPDIKAKVDEMFAAAARGDTQTVILLSSSLQLGWLSYDIERLSNLAKWYGPLETNGDALASLLQSHKDGKVELNDSMKAYLREALAQTTAAGQPMSDDVKAVYDKVMNGEDISEEEAKTLYSWVVGAKELVIPSEYRTATISEEIKRLQDQYEQKVQSSKTQLSSFSMR